MSLTVSGAVPPRETGLLAVANPLPPLFVIARAVVRGIAERMKLARCWR